MKTKFFLFFIFFFLLCEAFAQEKKDSTFIVSGKVISKNSLEGISFANVHLFQTSWGISCDSLGFFHLRVHPNQKLRISALGFKEQVVSVNSPNGDNEVFQEIQLEKESILIDEVSIYSLGSYSDFKKGFIKKEVSEEEDLSSSFDFGNLKQDQKEAIAAKRDGVGVDLTGGINKLKSIGAKRKERKTPIEVTDWQLSILQEKFNKQIIADITKESGPRLDDIMEYINNKEQFTYKTTELSIIEKIQVRYKEFLQEEPQEKKDTTENEFVGPIINNLRP
ncbi:carboxypeptidase-like regulatory domain-containing protein [Labilibaculum sp.]|uniref:carboxypeptidase-like regulatory domain-containing protein n=1 Tax=Labilibaculum sp. TaxID=2060723 RepID=UPI0035688AC3